MAFNEWRVRIDGDRSHDDQAIAFFKKRCDGFILVHHIPGTDENPHYHAYVRTKVTQGNMANFIKKEFGITKRTDYSCVTCSPDRRLEYQAYLFNKKKGNTPTYISSDGISPLDVKMAQETANQISVEFETRMKADDKKKLTKFDIAEKLSHEKFKDHGELYDAVVKLLHNNRMCSNSFVIKDIMSTTLNINGDKNMKACLLKYFVIEGING